MSGNRQYRNVIAVAIEQAVIKCRLPGPHDPAQTASSPLIVLQRQRQMPPLLHAGWTSTDGAHAIKTVTKTVQRVARDSQMRFTPADSSVLAI